MAHILNKTMLVDNQSMAIVHFYIESDGSADFVNEPFLDPNTEFDTVMAKELDSGTGLLKIPRLSIMNADYSLNGLAMTLSFEGAPGFPALQLCASNGTTMDFSAYGGIKDLTVSNKNIGLAGKQTVVGGNTARDQISDIPANADMTPRTVLNNQPDKMYNDPPQTNATNVIYPPANGTGRLLLTTQGMTLPSLIGGGFCNGSLVMKFIKYVG